MRYVAGHKKRPEATLLVASAGGHLEQLWLLRQRFEPAAERVEWVTFDDAQPRSLLAGERIHYVPYIPPRGYRQVARALPEATRLLRSGRFGRVVSTGSAIAAAFLPTASALRIPAHYVESATRVDGPSVTGRMLARVPGVRLYSQYAGWADDHWSYQGSLFDGYRRGRGRVSSKPAGRVVVTLGTMRRYGFRRALENLVHELPHVVSHDAEIIWQVGATDTTGLPIEPVANMPSGELKAAVADADLVIAHAGIGSCITALDAAKCPVILPRRHHHGEHVDDHQMAIAAELGRRDLAISVTPEHLSAGDFIKAMSRSVEKVTEMAVFRLSGT